jgi:hypothetical protein
LTAIGCGRVGFTGLGNSTDATDTIVPIDAVDAIDGSFVENRTFPDPTLCTQMGWNVVLRYSDSRDTISWVPTGDCYAEMAAYSFGSVAVQSVAPPML